jgi:hypothetical protein
MSLKRSVQSQNMINEHRERTVSKINGRYLLIDVKCVRCVSSYIEHGHLF